MFDLLALIVALFLVFHLRKRLAEQDKRFQDLEVRTTDLFEELERLRRKVSRSQPKTGDEVAGAEILTDHPTPADIVEGPWQKAGRAPLDAEEDRPSDTAQVAADAEEPSPPGEQMADKPAATALVVYEAPETTVSEVVQIPKPKPEPEPSSESVEPPAATAARPGLGQDALEQKLSTNWLVWIGGIALALAGIFLVRYIAEQGWLSPALRCAIGVIFGFALVASGEVVRRRPLERAIAAIRPDYVPQALTAAGLVTAFGSIYLAYAFYDLIPAAWSFSLLAVIALSAFALSVVQGRLVAVLGLLGATVTPALASTQDPSTWGFFSYLAIIVLATLGVADRKRWFWLPELALLATGGWTALWINELFQDADVVPIGVTTGVVALAGLILAMRAGSPVLPSDMQNRPGVRIGAEGVAWTGLILATACAFVLATGTDFLPASHWLLLCFVLAAAVIARVAVRFEAYLPGIALVSIVSFGLVYLDETAIENFAERLMGWPAPTVFFMEQYEKFTLHAVLLAVAVFGGGLQALSRSQKPRLIAVATGLTPIAFLLIGYAQYRNHTGDWIWVQAALVVLAAAVAATMLLRRTRAERADLQGIYAACAVIAAFLAVTFQFDRLWLTIAYAGLVFGLSLVTTRADYLIVRRLTNLIVLLVLARLTINPDLRGYEIFHPLGIQWVTYGYIVPLVLFIAASRIFKRQKDDLTVTVLEGAALLLAIMFVSIEIRIYMTGSIYSGAYRLPEASLQSIAWLTSAWVLALRNRRYPRIFSAWGSRLLTVAGALQAMALQLVLMNPVFTGAFIDGYGLFNMLILSLLAPAVLFWLIANAMTPPDQTPGIASAVASSMLRGCSGLLIFAFITEEVRVLFQGMLIRPLHVSNLELYITTLAWLLPASVPYLMPSHRALDAMRMVAFAVLLLSALVLLFGHAWIYNPALWGEVVQGWPVLNTLLLGFAIPAVLLYWVGRKVEQPVRGFLAASALVLGLIWVWLMIKNVFQGAQLVVIHESLLELYITTFSWLALAAAPFFIRRLGDQTDAKRAGYAALAVSCAMLFFGHSALFNPALDRSYVAGWPVFNVLLLGFIAPAALLGLIARRIDERLRSPVLVAAYILLFIGITLLVKHTFQGGVMILMTLSVIEDYTYSATWLVLALITMLAGIVWNNSKVRYASLGVLSLVVLKVFLLDMSGLAGLWRVASFFGLGVSLVGIGFVYQRFIIAQQGHPAEPGSPADKTIGEIT